MVNGEADALVRKHTDPLVMFARANSGLAGSFGNSFQVKQFEDYEAWRATGLRPSAFVIEAEDSRNVSDLLWKIREDGDVFSTLCFISGAVEPLHALLADGGVPAVAILKDKIARAVDLEASFKSRDAGASRLERLLKYLWLRPDFILQPQHEWRNPRFYHYPLLEALGGGESDAFDWLQSLAIAKVLEPVSLVDRQKECAFCRSAHLRFVDVCPNCRAIDIEKRAFLHCFTCGHVEAQEKFLNKGILVCPKCSAQLRHIGSDYDRPIENYSCRQCGDSFVEGEVLARCAMCAKEMAPEDLVTHNIHAWRLSDRGRTYAIRGETSDVFSPFDELNFVSNELFTHNLNWLLTQSRRYPEISFSVFGLYFANLPELTDLLGHARVMRLMESFAQRLREILRSPDLSTRTVEGMVWLLLPHTDEQGLHGLRMRIEHCALLTQQGGDQKLDCRFITIASPQIPGQESAELLLARLRSELF
jgi:GGDEF domain-containing protein